MVDKLRKATAWIWTNKERMVLLAMVGFLCYRVYMVVFPEELADEAPPRPPIGEIDRATAPPDILPPIPPANVRSEPEDSYASFVRRNPFSYHLSRPGSDPTGEEYEVDIALLNVQDMGNGRFRAQIRTGGVRKWYDVGDEFEEFRLDDIDFAEKKVVVYATRLQRQITLEMATPQSQRGRPARS